MESTKDLLKCAMKYISAHNIKNLSMTYTPVNTREYIDGDVVTTTIFVPSLTIETKE